MGPPFPEIRRALRTDGLSTLVSPCQYHHASVLSKPGGISVSKNTLRNIFHFLCRQGKASSEESRPLRAQYSAVGCPWLDARCLSQQLYHFPPQLSLEGKMNGLWVEIRTERPLSNYCHKNTPDSGLGHQLNLLPIKSEQCNEKLKPILKTPFHHPSNLPRLNFRFLYLLSCSSTGKQGTLAVGSSSQGVAATPFPLGEGFLALFPCSSVGFLPQERVLYALHQ